MRKELKEKRRGKRINVKMYVNIVLDSNKHLTFVDNVYTRTHTQKKTLKIMKSSWKHQQHFNGLSQTIQYLLLWILFHLYLQSYPQKRRKEMEWNAPLTIFLFCLLIQYIHILFVHGIVWLQFPIAPPAIETSILSPIFLFFFIFFFSLSFLLNRHLFFPPTIVSNQSKWETDVVVLSSMIENRSWYWI